LDKMTTKIKKHYYIWLIVALFILIGFLTLISVIKTNIHSLKTDSNQIQTKEYVNESLFAIISRFTSPFQGNPTELQMNEMLKERKNEFEQDYKGKWVKSSGNVMSVNEDIFKDGLINVLVAIQGNKTAFTNLEFNESEKSNLLSLEKWDEIHFEGRMKSYNFPLMPRINLDKAELG